MDLFDPSRALPSPPDSFIPLVSWSQKYREQQDAAVAEPIRDRYAADRHPRYQLRAELTAMADRALRSLATQFHRLPYAGLININTLTEPKPEEIAEAKERFDREPELYRLARRVADVRGFLAYLDELDARDKISSKPRTPEGNSSPGLATSGKGAPTSFYPAGLR